MVSWFNLCGIGQDFEEQMPLAESSAEDDKPLHRALV
jgi:hypothetical protein